MKAINPPWYIDGHADELPKEYWSDEGCYITELMNHSASPGASLANARVSPGVTTRLHALEGIIERYVIREGHGVVEIDNVKQSVTAGDQVMIPGGIAQRISNTGRVDLLFYCVCTPRFTQDRYIDLEPEKTTNQ